MKRFACFAAAAVLAFGCFARYTTAQGTDHPAGKIVVPESSIVRPEDAGRRAHTNIEIFVPDNEKEPGSAPSGETPASLACIYQLVPQVTGCPIKGTTQNPSGGSRAIGIVDAYDAPTIENDLGVFSTQFNLAPCTTENGCFTKVYASGTKPPENGDWALEMSLDVEWAHAMAPNAKIILVEAASQSAGDLLKAEDVASAAISAAGGGEVTNSWGFNEASQETTADSHFTTAGIVYFAAAGDTGGVVSYPSASPNVVSAGGTTVNRSGGDFTTETAWSDAGGGPSKYEPRPSDQDVIQSIVGSVRGTPDISFDGNPSSGVSIYDSTRYLIYKNWIVVGGTSVSSPSLAGIVNAAGSFNDSANAELTLIYNNYTNANYFRDITSGKNTKYSCVVGWDYCSGVGSALTYTDK